MTAPSYDDLWRTTWGDLQRRGPVHRRTRAQMLSLLARLDVRTILDVGCGAGDNLEALGQTGRYELMGVDVSPEALSIARTRVPTARLAVLDIEREALPERFDLVMSVQVIEHLVDDVSALRHMAAMTDGYVFASTMQGRMRPSEVSIGHVRNYSAVELRRKFELSGLKVVHMFGWGFPFYSPLYRTVVEWLPGGPPSGRMGWVGLVLAESLYHLYGLNWPGRGDVISILARTG